MSEQQKISIVYAEGQKINGLGMMIGQYLEQNLEEFEDKVRQGLKLNISTSVEVEKQISTTIRFMGNKISIENGIPADTHLHLKSSYATLADVLSGKVNPFKGVIKREIKIIKFAFSKPFQALRVLKFLKIPEELLIEKKQFKKPLLFHNKTKLLLISGIGCVFIIIYLFILLGWI